MLLHAACAVAATPKNERAEGKQEDGVGCVREEVDKSAAMEAADAGEGDVSVMLGSVESGGSSWLAKRNKTSKSKGLGLSIIPTEETQSQCFNLSDSGSFRQGLLHISQQGTTVHSARSLAASEPSDRGTPALSGGVASPTSCRSTTSAKRANCSDQVTYELQRSDFENMEVIGKGSSGYVRKARRKSTNEVLALKVINVFEEEKRRQMMQEVTMMCDAHHEALITFHGAFYNEGTISVVLEYMTGGSVSDVLKMAGHIPERILCLMSEQILDGMAFMHSRHQVHRDFKPCNLLLDHSGRVKITDLGVAAELDSSMVKCTTFVGTFLYMSPERFGSEPYSFPSDVRPTHTLHPPPGSPVGPHHQTLNLELKLNPNPETVPCTPHSPGTPDPCQHQPRGASVPAAQQRRSAALVGQHSPNPANPAHTEPHALSLSRNPSPERR